MAIPTGLPGGEGGGGKDELHFLFTIIYLLK